MELKPCPFCGGEAKLQSLREGYTGEDLYIVSCTNVDCSNVYMLDEEGAINAWNRRKGEK